MKPNELSLSAASLSALLEAVISRKSDFRFKANGFSMAPFIKDGDIITISPLSKSTAGIGKIAAFYRPAARQLVVHRIVGKNNGSYIIKGDGCQGRDGLIPQENVLGIATKVERQEREVGFGAGPERFVIAFLSRNNLLLCIFWLWKWMPLSLRRLIKCRACL